MKDGRGREKEAEKRKMLHKLTRSLTDQERFLRRRLIQERAEDLAAASQAREQDMEAFRLERTAKETRCEEARYIQRLLAQQISDKPRTRDAEEASGGMVTTERLLKKA